MEFGRVPSAELGKIDFSLPGEPAGNKKILTGKKNKNAKVFVGCAKWGRPEWVGTLYPLKTRQKDFLRNYVTQYNSIELNATHHKLYGERGISQWDAHAKGREFLFCPKLYKGITHAGKLTNKQFLTNEFFRGVLAFKEHLGPVFIQVNELFSPKRKDELFAFLQLLPKDLSLFLEVRHHAWFAPENSAELFDFLRINGIGAVITDTAGRRDCAHMQLTVPKAFIRFVGNSLHRTDYPRIDEWVKRIKSWLAKGIDEVYFFMHMHDEARSPELTVYLTEALNRECKLKLHVPQLVN